ncbi:hypothetical protein NDU88_000729 [Pleurodeles waltl]|uniref:Uncharacterized protein n=1 Tax=Pleurodeles waltl TaxID=8319 RepID=A0AAV7S6H7_PLEWA|nr:hypothetical protein NDU88_000729 [Pleurodeles waltl]
MKTTGAWESAVEERHQRLLEYLAAKGKLKPPKHYLRDALNHPPAGVNAHQKENLHITSEKPKIGSTELGVSNNEAIIRDSLLKSKLIMNSCGAVPIEELGEAIFDIMKNTNEKSKVTFDLLLDEALTAATESDSCKA